MTGSLTSGGEVGIATALVAAFVVGSTGYLTSARPAWALLALLGAAGAVTLGLVTAFANPSGVLPYVSAAPVSTDAGFWVFLSAAVLGLLTAIGMLGLFDRRSRQTQISQRRHPA